MRKPTQAKIQKMLDTAQTRASARCLTIEDVNEVWKAYVAGKKVAKAHQLDAETVSASYRPNVPNCYKFAPGATVVTADHVSGLRVYRGTANKRPNGNGPTIRVSIDDQDGLAISDAGWVRYNGGWVLRS